MEKRTVYIWLLSIITFVVLMIVTPAIPQSQEYHNFADQRRFLGIPNMLNVISNIPFLVIGLIGLVLCHYRNYFKLSLQGEVWGWSCFYIGVAAVGIGSSYYHLQPNDASLVWDRLPMTFAFTSLVAIFIIERVDEQKGTASLLPLLLAGIISILYLNMTFAFTSLVAIFIIERVDEQKGTASLLPLLLAGIISILYWRFFDDLRPYAVVQFVPCIALPLMAILLPSMYTHSTYWLWAAAFYLLAKIAEAEDKPIYELTHHVVSGHTLKHLSAALVPVFLTLMLTKRTVETQRVSLLRAWRISWTKVQKDEPRVPSSEYSIVSSQE